MNWPGFRTLEGNSTPSDSETRASESRGRLNEIASSYSCLHVDSSFLKKHTGSSVDVVDAWGPVSRQES